MKKNALYIHIGIPKTGSTALQHFLYENRDNLNRRGFSYLNLLRMINRDISSRSRNYEINGDVLLTRNGTVELDKGDFKGLIECIKNELKEYNVVISSEKLSEQSAELFECLHRKFEEVYCIVYMRRQDNWVESYYTQQIKNGAVNEDFKTFCKRMYENEKSLKYYTLISDIEKNIGKNHVIARVYEKGQLIGNTIEEDFLDALGIHDYNLDEWRVSERPNSRIDGNISKLMTIVASSREISGYHSRHSELVDIYERMSYKWGDRRSFSFSATDRKAYLQLFEHENLEVAKKYLNRENGELFYDEIVDTGNEENEREIQALLTDTIRFFSAWMTEVDNRLYRYENWCRRRIELDIKSIRNDRKIVIFGAGERCKRMLKTWFRCRWDLDISAIIDNDSSKSGEYLLGYRIFHFEEIKDWTNLFVLITVLRSDTVEQQLMAKGLHKGIDYVLTKEYFPECWE